MRISKYRAIFAKGYTPNWSEEFFVIKKIKNTVSWRYIINDFNGEEIIGIFYKKNPQKPNETDLEWKKSLRKKEINFMSNGKDMIIDLIVGLMKKTQYKWVNTYLSRMNSLVESLMLKLIYLNMQQKQI